MPIVTLARNKLACKALNVEAMVSKKISHSVHGGNVVQTLCLFPPTEDDAKTKLPQHAPKSKVMMEGGILDSYEPA